MENSKSQPNINHQNKQELDGHKNLTTKHSQMGITLPKTELEFVNETEMEPSKFKQGSDVTLGQEE